MRPSLEASIMIVAMCIAVRPDAFGSYDSRVELIGGGALSIKLPSAWTTTHVYHFEDEVYVFSDEHSKLFFADFGDGRPDPTTFGNDVKATPVVLNGQSAADYHTNERIENIVVELRCSEYHFLWLHVISKDPGRLAAILKAMRSVACVPQPRHGSHK